MKKNFLTLVFLIIAHFVIAQNYYATTQEEFGGSRVQMKNFEWKTIKSNNFEVNFYRGGAELAEKAAKIAEAEFNHITEVLGYTPFASMKIFIYNSSKDLAQSNIGLTSPIEYSGGVLNLSRSRVEIAYTGRDETYKEEIISQIAHLFVYDMLYGGSIKEVIQNSLLMSVPNWYMSGIARYVSMDNTKPETVEELRAKVVSLGKQKINYLKGDDAALIGHSIWFYIATRYGEDNISNILNLTRIIRTEESSITSTLGVSYTRFLREWQMYYQNESYKNNTTQTSVVSHLDSIRVFSKEEVLPKEYLTNKKIGEVDTENYTFDPLIVSEILKKSKTEINVLDKYVKSKKLKSLTPEEVKLSAPKAFQNTLISNEMKTEFLNDPIRRFGIKANFMLNDILENNIFKLGVFIAPSFKNHDIFAEYRNTKKRIDWGFNFERRSIYIDNINSKNQYLLRPLHVVLPSTATFAIARRMEMHSLSATVIYPISSQFKVTFNPFVTKAVDIDYTEIANKNLESYYIGGKAEMIFDNTSLGFNGQFTSGTKAKLRVEEYAGLGKTLGFNRVILDMRHYQKITIGIILAGRFSAGRSLGKAPQIAFLGGTENWINRQVQATNGQAIGIPGDLRSLLFNYYPGSLRGFYFGKLYGTSHFLTNLELRISVADFLPKGTITSNSLRNFQFVAFNDIGTAWEGSKGPFSRQNSLNTELIGGGASPFRAVVTNFKNPFLMGYGFGIRTTVLGYFVRCDYAWGIEDKATNKPILHLSLGHDF